MLGRNDRVSSIHLFAFDIQSDCGSGRLLHRAEIPTATSPIEVFFNHADVMFVVPAESQNIVAFTVRVLDASIIATLAAQDTWGELCTKWTEGRIQRSCIDAQWLPFVDILQAEQSGDALREHK
jgi:hypothetical protein